MRIPFLALCSALLFCSLIACNEASSPTADSDLSAYTQVNSKLKFALPKLGSVSKTEVAITRDLPTQKNFYAYDYAPSILHEGDKYKVWWCGTAPDYQGDFIFYSEASSFGGTWSTPIPSLPASRIAGTFDAEDACDPEVIKQGDTYYNYYGGLGYQKDAARSTRIGIATSKDGIHWERANKGRALIGPKLYENGEAYGAGQPSVVHAGAYYYMVYTTVWNTIKGGGALGGEYVIRAKDPLFTTDVQELQNAGWKSIGLLSDGTLAVVRDHPLDGGSHVKNLVYLHEHGVFMLVGPGNVTDLKFFDENFKALPAHLFFEGANFREQKGIARDGDGHIFSNATHTYHMEIMAAIWKGVGTKENIFYYDLGRQTVDLIVP